MLTFLVFLSTTTCLALAQQLQLHNDTDYTFVATHLKPDELLRMRDIYKNARPIPPQTSQTARDARDARIDKFIDNNINSIRITRDFMPLAFQRLVEEADAVELAAAVTSSPPPPPPPPPPPTTPLAFSKRKLLSHHDEDEFIEPDEVDEYDDDVAVAVTRGANGNHKHCDSGREVAALPLDRMPDLSTLHPALSLHIDEESGWVRFNIETPYIPFDARYIISFDPIEHAAERPLRCSSNFDGGGGGGVEKKSTQPQNVSMWAHAPNANYRDAFTSRDLYPAYYAPPDARWSASASGCSHVKYGATFTIDELANCSDSAGRFAVATTQLSGHSATSLNDSSSGGGAVSLIGIVWVSLLQPSEASVGEHDTLERAVVVAKWAHPFSLVVDERDSKVVLVDAANGGVRRPIEHTPVAALKSRAAEQRPRAVTILRSASVGKSGHLTLRLQTQLAVPAGAECVPRNMSLAPPLWREFDLAPVHDSEVDEAAFCVQLAGDSVVLQNFQLRSKVAAHVYDGDFVLLFCEQTGAGGGVAACDEATAVHRTTLSVRVSRESGESNEDVVFHSEITQHLDNAGADVNGSTTTTAAAAAAAAELIGNFASGQRACMQSYVIGPKQLTSQIEVHLVEAWLCTNDDGGTATGGAAADPADFDEFSCAAREHAVPLVRTRPGGSATELLLDTTRNVTVHHPGAYGLLSVGVCFDVNARFTDAANRTLVARKQRYEARVRMQPATVRRYGPVHIAPLFPALLALARRSERTYDPVIEALAAQSEHQFKQRDVIVSGVLRKALDSARRAGVAVETHGHEFVVDASEHDAGALGEATVALALVLALVIILLFGVLVHTCIVTPTRLSALAQRFH